MYYDNQGPANTEQTIALAVETAKTRGIGYIVIASHTGQSAVRLAGSGVRAICVTHVGGASAHKGDGISDEMAGRLQEADIPVVTAAHALSGVERAISRKSGGMYPVEIMANTLRMFGQGVKVCVEVATMALDAGLLPEGEPVIAIGGTSHGSDTAVILTPGHAADIFDTRVHEILCKPV